jgi:hypothetical protein
MTQQEILRLIEKWQFYWMSKEQNPDSENNAYFNKAAPIDANMRHHLADMIAEKLEEKK